MKADPRSLIYQLVGEKVTVLSINKTGTIGKVEISKDSKYVTFILHITKQTELSYKTINEVCRVNLSLVSLFKDIRLHSLI